MAHLVEQMFSVRQVPWHKLGVIVENAPTAQEAIKLAGLDWRVNSHPISFGTADGFNIQHTDIKGYKALVRGDNQKVMSVMTESYHPLQNEDAFKFFNPFIDSGLASFETAGSLKEGKVVWILANLNKAPIDVGGGDLVNKYLLLSNSHDGSMAVRVGFTPVRVVCRNTLAGSISNSDSKLIRVRHSSNVAQKVEDLRQIVNAIDAKFEATADQYKKLANTSINKSDLEKYVEIVFETRPNGNEREQSRDKKMKEIITRLFENGAGQHLKSARGTYWGAYNAVTEYLSHEYGTNEESRLHANWFGSVLKTNEEALTVALKEAI